MDIIMSGVGENIEQIAHVMNSMGGVMLAGFVVVVILAVGFIPSIPLYIKSRINHEAIEKIQIELVGVQSQLAKCSSGWEDCENKLSRCKRMLKEKE